MNILLCFFYFICTHTNLWIVMFLAGTQTQSVLISILLNNVCIEMFD